MIKKPQGYNTTAIDTKERRRNKGFKVKITRHPHTQAELQNEGISVQDFAIRAVVSSNDEAVAEEAVVEESIVEERILEEPVIEEPVIDEAVVEEPAVEEPGVDTLLNGVDNDECLPDIQVSHIAPCPGPANEVMLLTTR